MIKDASRWLKIFLIDSWSIGSCAQRVSPKAGFGETKNILIVNLCQNIMKIIQGPIEAKAEGYWDSKLQKSSIRYINLLSQNVNIF